ncbi:MAG: hypothetical protein IT434_16055 [Phycisphaerales bacterium]|nr:hypothetical protein [Phycisphaerales bacterium]
MPDPDSKSDNHGAFSIAELYKAGSDCCKQYSQLTMDIRRFAQQMLVTYAVGIGIVFSRSHEAGDLPYLGVVLILAGVILNIFGAVLWILNQHYSKAFEAIRDGSLVKIEKWAIAREKDQDGLTGPWSEHSEWRKTHRPHPPFVAQLTIGGLSVVAGVIVLVVSYCSSGHS